MSDNDWELYNACKEGDMVTVGRCIDEGADVNMKYEDGWTPLMYAMACNHPPVVSLLLTCQNLEMTAVNSNGRTALHCACGFNSAACISVLGTDDRRETREMINMRDSDGRTALMWAVVRGNLDCVEEMAKLLDLDITAVDGNGATALHLACYFNRADSISVLGRDRRVINMKDNDGTTALMMAVEKGYLDCLKEMVKLDLDIAAVDGIGGTALHWACYNHAGSISVLGRDRRVTREVINMKDNEGRTALMVAVQEGKLDSVKEMAKLEGVDWKEIVEKLQSLTSPPNIFSTNNSEMADSFPEIKSKHSLVAKYVTEPIWEKLGHIKTKTAGFTLGKAIACAVQFDNQHCGIYAGDWDSYSVFGAVFDPLIQEYHGISADSVHTSDMDVTKIKGNINPAAPVHSTRIRVGRSIDGFGLSPGITKEQRLGVESLMTKAFANLKGDLAGTYFPLTGMNEKVRQQLVDDHFLFVSGDPNLKVAGMERDWPEGRGIFHNKDKTFLTWVNEEDQLRIISMQKGGDVRAVFDRLARGIKAVGDSVKAESGKDFMLDPKYGYIHSCPTNLGTGMRASVHIDLPGYTKLGLKVLQARCEELHLQPRGTRGESGGQTGITYDISNKHRLGYSEVELVQKMIDGVNTLHKEDEALRKAHGI